MSNTIDFVIENGVLTKYVGPGGDVVVPEGVKEIGYRAFEGDYFGESIPIESVTLPDSVVRIEDSAFELCTLKRITIPNPAASIGRGAFCDCARLEDISLPEQMTVIEDRAFAGCKSMKKLTLPTGLTAIGEAAFRDWQMSSLIIPAGVKEIGADAFKRCTKLCSAGPIGSGCDYEFPWTEEIPDNAFSGLTKLKRAVLPATIKKVGGNAFKDCKELTDLTMPKAAKVGKTSFKGCAKLGEIKEPGTAEQTAPVAEPEMQKPVGKKREAKPEFVIVSGRLVQYNGKSEAVTIPNDVTIIGRRAFYGNQKITSATIPASVDTVEQEAFDNCNALETISILGTIRSAGKNAFGFFFQKEALELSVYSAIPISAFTKAAQDGVLRAFVRRFAEFDPISETYQDNLRFIGTHLKQQQEYGNKQFYHYLIENEALRHAVLDADTIPAKDLKWLITALQTEGQTEITAELLEYQNRLLADDKVKKSLEESVERAEKKALAAEMTATDWRKLLKFSYEDGDVVIKEVKIKEPVIKLPDHIGERRVRVIGYQAFPFILKTGETDRWCPEKIILPEGIEEVRSGAFFGVENMEIVFPSTVKSLPRACFYAVENLTLHIPASVTEIADELEFDSGEPAIKVIRAPAGSYAEQYAKEHGIPFAAE